MTVSSAPRSTSQPRRIQRTHRTARGCRGRCRRGHGVHLFLIQEHLVAEVFGAGLPAPRQPPPHESDDRDTRVVDVPQHIALLVADEPEFAGAVTSALLGRGSARRGAPSADRARLRERLDGALAGRSTRRDRLVGDAVSGALVRVGIGTPPTTGSRQPGEVGAPHARLRSRSEEGPAPAWRPVAEHSLDVSAVFDERGRQFPEAAEQDQRERSGDGCQAGADESGAAAGDQHVREVLHRKTIQRSGEVAVVRVPPDPAQGDGGARSMSRRRR